MVGHGISVALDGRAPIYEALVGYRQEVCVLLHMPGHTGGRGFGVEELQRAGELDFTEVNGLDDLHRPSGPIEEARKLLASAFGAEESFFLVNGASSGIHALFLATCQEKKPVLVPRNGHRSFLAGLVLTGAVPVYYRSELLDPWGIEAGARIEDIKRLLGEHTDASCVFVVAPTYFGTVTDVELIAKLSKTYGKMVLVDEAHGAHFNFHPRLPSPAISVGCAAAVHGMHKVLPVLTQGAALHIGAGFTRRRELSQAFGYLTTTSPSYPLLASMDLARLFMEKRGRDALEQALGWAEKYRKAFASIPGIICLGDEFLSVPGVKGYDPLKVVIVIDGLPLTGYQLEKLLRTRFRIQVEMAARDYVLAMFSMFHHEDDWEHFYGALRTISSDYRHASKIERSPIPAPPVPRVVLTPREAFFAAKRRVRLFDSVGRVSGEMVAGYPPGIPCLMPGELITLEACEYLVFLKNSGARIQGPEDLELNYLYVVEE